MNPDDKRHIVSYRKSINSKKWLRGYVSVLWSTNLTIPVISGYELFDKDLKSLKIMTPIQAEQQLARGLIVRAENMSH